nr:organic cation transporter protein-like [Onthophagus taurus]
MGSGDVLEATIGSFGRFQCRIFILVALLKVPISWFQLGIVFMAPPTEYWCRQPEDFKFNLSTEEWRSFIKINETQNPCLMANVEYKNFFNNTLTACKWGYDYDKKIIESSMISEWNLVCGDEHLVNLVQIIFMVGVLLGGILFGILSDHQGRKKTLIICILIQSTLGLISSWIPWFTSFLIVRFFLGLSNGGITVTSFVMCMEIVSGKFRSIIPILYQIPFGLGNSLMALFAYFIRNWRQLQLVLSSFSLVFVSYYWFLSESPRWLIATNQKKRAFEVLEKALRFNRIENKDLGKVLEKFVKKDDKKDFRIIFRERSLRKVTFIMSFEWFFLGNIFYSFTQYLGVIGNNVFINVSISGLITIPASILCLFILKKLGRKLTMTISQLTMSLIFFALIFENWFPFIWISVILAALGIITLTMSTSVLFLYTGELYPTIVRNSSVGFCSMLAKVGAIISPFIYSTKDYYKFLPLIIMAAMAILNVLILIPLPETLEMDLTDNLKDLEMRTINEEGIENERFLENNQRNKD